jgi:diaminopimelate decarboxylase
VKANDHLAILGLYRTLGAGADVVSVGEFMRTQQATIAAGLGQINVESAEELGMISAIATQAGCTARVALRMNPDVDAGTHEKITTGLADNKFGIPAQDVVRLYAHAATLPGIQPVGIALHIGSQILSPAPYANAYAKAADIVRGLRAAGQNVSVLDLGGGLGIGYGDEPGISVTAFASVVKKEAGDLGVQLLMEPGRYLVGPAGLLLASVILEKRGQKRFVVLDTAMNDLMRPAMYDAWHGILPVSAAQFCASRAPADVVGPVCESADSFATGRDLPAMPPGARVAILDAGAYGAVMSSTYNARPRAAAVLIDGGKFHLITPRQTIENLWADEMLPPLAG